MKHLRIAAALAAVALGALGHRADATEPATFRFERSIETDAPGAQRLPIDATLLADADPGRGLADLRLFDGSGRELGYLLVAPPSPAPTWRDATVVPGKETRDESSFEADLGAPLSVDRLELDGLRAPFLKRVRLEGSADRVHWVTLAADETVFDLPEDGLRRTELGFTPGVFRYVHLTWDDRSSTRASAPARVALRLRREVATEPPLVAPVVFERRTSEPRTSRFRLRLPGVRLPLIALEIEAGGSALLRPVRVLEPRFAGHEVTPTVLGTSTLRRAVHDGLVAADLRVPIQAPQGADLDLVVDDGDNPPLDITAVRAVFAPQPWIYFETTAPGPIVARFGNAKLTAPHYDLEAMRGAAAARAARHATWGDVRPEAPQATAQPPIEQYPLEGSALDRSGFAYARRIGPGKLGLTAVLLDAAVLAHAHGTDDLRIVDSSGHQVPYLVETRDEPLALDVPLAPEPARASGAIPGESRYRISFPFATLPAARLLVSSPSHVFDRELHLEAGNPEPLAPRAPPTRTVGEAHWSHRDPETAAAPVAFELPALGVDHVVLDVEEGDNRPLPLEHAKLLLPASRLRFFRSSDGDLTLLYGRPDLGAPRYDLALLAPRLVGMIAEEVALEGEAAGVVPKPPSRGPTNVFWGALVVAVAVLLGLIGRLVTRSEAA